jgi:hypothetical protein
MPEVKKVSVVPVLAVGGLYAAADAVGGLIEFAGVVDYPGKGGKIVGVTILDKAAQALGLTLQLFDTAPTPITDNAVYNPTDADAAKAIGHIAFVAADYIGGAANKVAYKDTDIDFQTQTTRSIWGQLFTQGAPTYAAGDLTVTLHVVQSEKLK